MHDTLTAQSARLGYSTPRLAMRLLGELATNLTEQVWQRAHAQHVAAQARNNDCPLLFLEPEFAHAGCDCATTALASAGLIALAGGLR